MMKVQADITGPLLTADKYWISQLSRAALNFENKIGFSGVTETKVLTLTMQIKRHQ
jgi:hypothetical protein